MLTHWQKFLASACSLAVLSFHPGSQFIFFTVAFLSTCEVRGSNKDDRAALECFLRLKSGKDHRNTLGQQVQHPTAFHFFYVNVFTFKFKYVPFNPKLLVWGVVCHSESVDKSSINLIIKLYPCRVI